MYKRQGEVPTLQDFRAELLKQDEPEAKEIALAIELFTSGSLNTFAKHTNVDTNNRLICYDILDLCQPIDNWELLQITGLWSGQVDGLSLIHI